DDIFCFLFHAGLEPAEFVMPPAPSPATPWEVVVDTAEDALPSAGARQLQPADTIARPDLSLLVARARPLTFGRRDPAAASRSRGSRTRTDVRAGRTGVRERRVRPLTLLLLGRSPMATSVPSDERAHAPGPLVGTGGTTFRVWAPDSSAVEVQLHAPDGSRHPLRREGASSRRAFRSQRARGTPSASTTESRCRTWRRAFSPTGRPGFQN